MSATPMDNRSLLAKADLALSDLSGTGGLLLPAQAAKFMRIMVKESRLLGLTTVVPMKSPKQQLPKIKFGSRILRAGAEARVEAEVVSATAVGAEQLKTIAAALKQRLGRDVTLATRLDPSLVGGIVIRAGDLVIDGSVRGKLRALATHLTKS